ncbi:hypothetical protein NUBL12144_06450 [Klebsiella pneumoniae]|nr:hypothetical protein NUBL12144_06450 [Klebsiella pneumoniae]
MINAPANRTPAQAGADLMVAVAVVAGIIRFDVNHFIITHVQPQGAAAAAVNRAGAPDNAGVVPVACCTAAAARRSVKGRVSPPAASAREPRAVDLSSARRLTPPGDS